MQRHFVYPISAIGTLIALIGPATPLLAQANSQTPVPGRNGHYSPALRKGGKWVGIGEPAQNPQTLDHLITMSNLIVDGTVLSRLPSIHTSKTPDREPFIMETHSVISVGEVLKGAVRGGGSTILIAQGGGQLDNWDVTIKGDPLLSKGERYIFFLRPDDDRPVPNTSGSPRYSVVGAWSGKVKVVDDKVDFLPDTRAALQRYKGTDARSFVQEIRDKIKNPPVSAEKLPIHPPPPASSVR
jgi:hypothetical protein